MGSRSKATLYASVYDEVRGQRSRAWQRQRGGRDGQSTYDQNKCDEHTVSRREIA
jgi:hypothetical protein